MSYENAQKYFSNLKYVIVDELHNIIHTKRGDLLLLNLSRLSEFAPSAIKIGLSATLNNRIMALNYFRIQKIKSVLIQKLKKKYQLKLLKPQKQFHGLGTWLVMH